MINVNIIERIIVSCLWDAAILMATDHGRSSFHRVAVIKCVAETVARHRRISPTFERISKILISVIELFWEYNHMRNLLRADPMARSS
jgi:hypothetical protein